MNERRRWASRLLAISMCMTVALMGLGDLGVSNASAKGGAYVSYQGPNTIFNMVSGVNLIRFYCDPYVTPGIPGVGTPMTAEWLCDNAVNGYIPYDTWPHHYCVRVAYWNDVTQMWVVHEAGQSGTDFILKGGEAYNIQFSYTYGNGLFYIPIPYGWCPTGVYARVYIGGAADWSVYDMVGWYSSFYTPPVNPPPPPPPPPGHVVAKVMASDWMAMVRDGHMLDYHHQNVAYTSLHIGRLCCWNETTQALQVYESWVPSSNFVVWSCWADTGEPITPNMFDGMQMHLEAYAYFVTNPQ
jgi:hypothetical protein